VAALLDEYADLRPEDFGELKHVDGISPAWPVSYADFEPLYTKAEWLYQVHGDHGEDPTEGPVSRQYPWPPVSHEPVVQRISDVLAQAGYHPFHAPCGILLNEADGPAAPASAARPATASRAWCTPSLTLR
jgi:choline dehydrogenase-like flavoprotein